MIYPGNISGNIGALLRLIQEEKAASPAALPPETAVASPMRGIVQQPLRSPEAPGGTRVVSMRPEGVTSQGPAVAPTVVPAARPVAPIAPPSPVVAPSGPAGAAGPAPAPSQPSVQGASAPSIATKVMPTQSPQQSAWESIQKFLPYFPTPQRSRVGPQMVQPAPTPTPAQGTEYVPGKGFKKPGGGFYLKTPWGMA